MHFNTSACEDLIFFWWAIQLSIIFSWAESGRLEGLDWWFGALNPSWEHFPRGLA